MTEACEEIIHGLYGQPCDCTLHDVGLNCTRKMTRSVLMRKVDAVVLVALRSGFDPVDVVRAFATAFDRHHAEEAKR